MRRLLLLAGLTLGASLPAFAGGGDCGKVTFAGECVDATLRYCDEDMLTTIDCATQSVGGLCQTFNEDYGSDCALAVGDACLFVDDDENIFSSACQGEESGCVETATAATCVQSVGTCTSSDTGTCRGQRLVVACPDYLQPYLLDCDSLGATCQTDRCADVAEGGFCDDVNTFCAAGLTCNADSICTSATTPAPDAGADDTDAGPAGPADSGASGFNDATAGDGVPDAGFGFPDATGGGGGGGTGGPTTDRDDDGCRCVVTAPAENIWLAFGCVLLGLLGRRRRQSTPLTSYRARRHQEVGGSRGD